MAVALCLAAGKVCEKEKGEASLGPPLGSGAVFELILAHGPCLSCIVGVPMSGLVLC